MERVAFFLSIDRERERRRDTNEAAPMGIGCGGSIFGGRRGRRGGREKQRWFVGRLRKPMWSPGFDGPKGRTGWGRASARVDGIRRDGEREEAAKPSSSLPAARCEVRTQQAAVAVKTGPFDPKQSNEMQCVGCFDRNHWSFWFWYLTGKED
ncbi:unnamed protein product [Lactuca saligna]|uniref:Uncharacterized protein n=1 Tax=Lactuca saligna TaxID=75948 RepID=A0AA35YGV4_LACSI|nr:unnamed protein product [Lactuca saligna]